MQSTDNNLNNPLRVGDIDISQNLGSWDNHKIKIITQEMYDLIQIHDPMTTYVINDAEDGRMYLGDHLISKKEISSKYFIGIDNNTMEYILYLNIAEQYHDRLIPISRYENPKQAFEDLQKYNNWRPLKTIDHILRFTILSYIDNHISIHALIVNTLSSFGYRDDPRLQSLICVATSMGTDYSQVEVSPRFKYEIHNMHDTHNNSLFKTYSKIYDVISKYDFFRDAKYHSDPNNVDISQPISDIISILNE